MGTCVDSLLVCSCPRVLGLFLCYLTPPQVLQPARPPPLLMPAYPQTFFLPCVGLRFPCYGEGGGQLPTFILLPWTPTACRPWFLPTLSLPVDITCTPHSHYYLVILSSYTIFPLPFTLAFFLNTPPIFKPSSPAVPTVQTGFWTTMSTMDHTPPRFGSGFPSIPSSSSSFLLLPLYLPPTITTNYHLPFPPYIHV